jgi:hypothetical protein
METVSERRSLSASPERVRDLIAGDVPAFVRASGFDDVTVQDGQYTVSRDVGLATLKLTLESIDGDAFLEFEQTDGLFEEMWTAYRVEPAPEGCTLSAETEFTLGGVLGPVLDATLIERQRRQEFDLQFDYVAERLVEGED